jgi:hypothetical protein
VGVRGVRGGLGRAGAGGSGGDGLLFLGRTKAGSPIIPPKKTAANKKGCIAYCLPVVCGYVQTTGNGIRGLQPIYSGVKPVKMIDKEFLITVYFSSKRA